MASAGMDHERQMRGEKNMDVKDYIRMCRIASQRTRDRPYKPEMDWRNIPKVLYRDSLYIPMDYRFGFSGGNPRHIAILRDTRADSVVEALVENVEPR